jgi:predicted peptidase
MTARLPALLGAALLCLAAAARADEPKTGFLDRTFTDADGKEAKYVLYVPDDYKGDKPYPLILFLHGAGETGTDGKKQATVGLGPAVKKMDKFPAIVVFPQSQDRTWDADSKDGKRALANLEAVQKEYKVDDKRIYLTGLSMGGFGTWSFAVKYPDRWAAIVPICGGGDPSKAEAIKDIPCWCFHGDADKAVSVEKSRKMIDALKAAGGKPNYDEYPDVGHNSWDKAYGTKELFDWLFKQHK